MAMYENDEIDITGVSLFDLERVLDPNDELNAQLIVAPPSFSVSYIGFNTTWPPFDDPKFRQALNHAVDKDLIATEVLAGLVEPAYGVLPPGFPGYNPDHVGLRYDPELAKQLFAESKYAGDIPRIEITVPGTGGTIGLNLEVVLEMWRSTLGVEVEIVQVEWATYLKDLQENKFQAFAGLGWEADYPDPRTSWTSCSTRKARSTTGHTATSRWTGYWRWPASRRTSTGASSCTARLRRWS